MLLVSSTDSSMLYRTVLSLFMLCYTHFILRWFFLMEMLWRQLLVLERVLQGLSSPFNLFFLCFCFPFFYYLSCHQLEETWFLSIFLCHVMIFIKQASSSVWVNGWYLNGRYDLTRLIIGSEGTLGVITEVTLRLQKIPQHSVVYKLTSSFIASFPSLMFILFCQAERYSHSFAMWFSYLFVL